MTEPTRQFSTYRHYQGGVYLVLTQGVHTETGEDLTVYACALSGKVFCRPTAMFHEVITENGYQGPRFIPFAQTYTKAQCKSLRYDDTAN
ncbi:MAG: DUF1653 domain-containing protein [Alphaproteobacteria bacterium]|nr:MAG: DUF1653 domain-containing protein [Alphaproteobacteria bacterium]